MWNNDKNPMPNGGVQHVCPTCKTMLGPANPNSEQSRAIFKQHWAKVHAAQGIPQVPKL